jgi:hypothetical protein
LNQKTYDTALNTYTSKVNTLLSKAKTTEKTVIDKLTNESSVIKETEIPRIPDFQYQSKVELDTRRLSGRLSTDTMDIVKYLVAKNYYDTFDEVINHINDEINTTSKILLDKTQINERLISTNGVLFPVANAVNDTPSTFTMAGRSVNRSSLMFINILFSDGINNADVISAEYTISINGNRPITLNSFEDAIVNGKLAVKIALEQINVINTSLINLSGVFNLSNGDKINFTGGGSIIRDGSVFFGSAYSLNGNGSYKIEKLVVVENPGSTLDYIPSGFGIKRLGIADYRKVEQEICCYVPGEVSHIENIMASEYKERATRSLQRREETDSITTEKETEKLTDTTTNSRFEMNEEVSNILAQDSHLGVNVNASYSYGSQNTTGVFGLNAGADYATNTSKEESNNQAVTQAKDITERALERIVQKVKQERVVKIINEFEETNKHGYDNAKNANHISGIYRWVDKIYRNTVVNYGIRAMYEFMIPEPASFHNLATAGKMKGLNGEILEKPIDPRKATNSPITINNLDWSKAEYWSSILNVSIEKLPDQVINFPVSFHEGNMGLTGVDGSGLRPGGYHFELKLPERYQATRVSGNVGASRGFWTGGIAYGSIDVIIGNQRFPISLADGSGFRSIPVSVDLNSNKIVDNIPISVNAWDIKVVSGSLIATCELTPEAFKEWQINTFNTIIQAYERKLEEYNQKVRQLSAQNQGTNPLFYRQIENTVLRKNCIEYMISHDALGNTGLKLVKGTTLTDIQVDYDNPNLESYAAKVKFFEQAFEWGLMSYNFYPLYWNSKNKWSESYNVTEFNDPIFRAFLQSGMARVIVTVRPGFEEAVNWYMATGQIWNGGQVPTMDDPLFVSIVDELREPKGSPEETWETRVPTSLTILQAGSAGLEVEQALPCDEDCEDNVLFDSDGNRIKSSPFKFNNLSIKG